MGVVNGGYVYFNREWPGGRPNARDALICRKVACLSTDMCPFFFPSGSVCDSGVCKAICASDDSNRRRSSWMRCSFDDGSTYCDGPGGGEARETCQTTCSAQVGCLTPTTAMPEEDHADMRRLLDNREEQQLEIKGKRDSSWRKRCSGIWKRVNGRLTCTPRK